MIFLLFSLKYLFADTKDAKYWKFNKSLRWQKAEIIEVHKNYSEIKKAELKYFFCKKVENGEIKNNKKICYLIAYHRFTDFPLNDYETTPYHFYRHIEFFEKRGFEIIPLKWLIDALYTGRDDFLPDTSVVITIDDGYRCFFKIYDFVKKREIPLTHFIYINFVEAPGGFNWDELRKLAKEGFDIQSHTISHPDLTEISDNRLRIELELSKKWLEDELGVNIYAIAYPYGAVDQRVEREAILAGYWAGITIYWGYNDLRVNPMRLRRLEIFSHDTPRILSQKLLQSNNYMREYYRNKWTF